MSFVLLFCFVGFLGSAIAGYFDLKTSEIPDEVPLSISIIGIVLYILDFLINKNPLPFISVITCVSFFLAVGYILFWISQWGEADALILASIGILIPGLYPLAFANNFFDAFLFANKFLIVSFAIGGIYAILFSIMIMIKNNKAKAFFKYVLKRKTECRVIVVFSIIGIFFWYVFLIPFFFILWQFAKFTDEFVYKKKIKTSNLQEGDVIAQEIKVLKICGKKYEGISKSDIIKIKKIRKYIYIKDGVRYAPVFFFTIVFFCCI